MVEKQLIDKNAERSVFYITFSLFTIHYYLLLCLPVPYDNGRGCVRVRARIM